MRRIKPLLIVLLVGIILLPNFVKADSIINNNGIEISEEDYNNFIQIKSHEYIMAMDRAQYEKLLSLDYSNIMSEKKYYAVTYNPSLGLTTEIELTENEYDNFIETGYVNLSGGNNPDLSGGNNYYETTAKSISLVVVGGSVYNFVTLGATWKYIPNTRSFDVIGLRGYGLSFREGSQEGMQMYKLNGSYTHIDYAWNGTNIKKFSNGFGISMNIVNSAITNLSLEIECDIEADIDHPSLYGSYQHAVSNITLATSQNYVMTGGGLGNVFVYPNNIVPKYDGMSGVSLHW